MGLDAFPLDLDKTSYSYIERPNTVLVGLIEDRILQANPSARILALGCGAGANARALLAKHPSARIQGVEPNERAAALAREGGVDVFHGMLHEYLATSPEPAFDGVVLSDVLEHIPDPVKFLRELLAYDGVRNATFVISVPNYAVWYNRVFTAMGTFDYAWSGLYDRTHLRFFTKSSLEKLLEYLGLRSVAVRCTPSIVQSAAPILRRFFENDVASGDHLSLTESKAFKLYRTAIEPLETAVCRVWPGLLGFQIVVAAKAR
ncbi:hypothetical protein BH09MYX1_BH09MYX1_54650 [soil metagenome]